MVSGPVSERKGMLLRLDPAVHDALAKWAADELRSTNAQIEFLLRRALAEAGRLPGDARRTRPRGRPPASPRAGQASDLGDRGAAGPRRATARATGASSRRHATGWPGGPGHRW
ncbi:MAG: hypothetical protein QOG05_4952 [Streptosporangiaceae bacterium]|nr:hypothetical protein [Streptosporangiaceae bacterium]